MSQRVFVFLAVIGVLIPALAGARTLDPLVSVDWLEKHLGEDDLVVLDVRSEIDGSDREDFEAAHIPARSIATTPRLAGARPAAVCRASCRGRRISPN